MYSIVLLQFTRFSLFSHIFLVSVYDRGEHNQFLFEEKIISQSGTFPKEMTYEFDFVNAKLEHDSYNGVNAKLRYFLVFRI